MAESTYDPDDPFADLVEGPDPFAEFVPTAPVDAPPPAQFPSDFPMEPGTSRAAIQVPEMVEVGMQEFLPGATPMQAAGTTAAAMTMTDPQEIATMITSQFPQVGAQYAPDGTLMLFNNETGTRALINRPGISAMDVMQMLGLGAAFTPAGRAGMAAGAGSRAAAQTALSETARREALKQGTRRAAAATAAGAGATEAGLQVGQQQAGGTFDEGDIALSTIMGAVPEYGAQPLARAGTRLKELVSGAGEVVPANIRQALEYAKATGREITTSDALQEYLTPALNIFFKMTERIPITGTGKQRIRQRAQRADSLMEIARKFDIDVDSELGQEIVESFVDRMKARRFFGANKNPTNEMVERAFGREADEITDTILQRYIRAGKIDETLADKVFDKGSRAAVDQFYNKLNDSGKQAARQRFMARALNEAGWRPESPQVADADKFMQFLDKPQARNAIKTMFTDAEQDTLTGIREYLRLTKPAQEAGAGAGMTAAVAGGLGFAYGILDALVGSAAIAGGAGRVAQSAATRNLLLKLAHAKGDEEATQQIMEQLRPLVIAAGNQWLGDEVQDLPNLNPEITPEMIEQGAASGIDELRRRTQEGSQRILDIPARLTEMLID